MILSILIQVSYSSRQYAAKFPTRGISIAECVLVAICLDISFSFELDLSSSLLSFSLLPTLPRFSLSLGMAMYFCSLPSLLFLTLFSSRSDDFLLSDSVFLRDFLVGG